MAGLRWLTAGESHGPGLIGVIEGMPAGLEISPAEINYDLRRRQQGYGRGRRQTIETDQVQILGGVRDGKTLGSPISLMVVNKDWENWQGIMSIEAVDDPERRSITRPRPGHADLAGGLKYNHTDLRNVLERSSARETTMRVALGAVARALLRRLGIEVFGHVIRIGPVAVDWERVARYWDPRRGRKQHVDIQLIRSRLEASPVRTLDEEAEADMIAAIDTARNELDSIGGVFEIVALNLPPGLGSYVHWDRRLDGRIAQALISIQAMKGVEFGLGFEAAARPGSEVHDEIFYDPSLGYYRETNRAGGLEGGMTNGEPLIVRVAKKPLPTLRKPLRSVDMASRESFEAVRERSDTCAVPAAAVIGEAMVCLVLADAVLEKFGGDSMDEVLRNFQHYMDYVAKR